MHPSGVENFHQTKNGIHLLTGFYFYLSFFNNHFYNMIQMEY